MFARNSVYGVVGTMLFLIALYLVLTGGGPSGSGSNTTNLIRAIGGTTSDIAKTLQGR